MFQYLHCLSLVSSCALIASDYTTCLSYQTYVSIITGQISVLLLNICRRERDYK